MGRHHAPPVTRDPSNAVASAVPAASGSKEPAAGIRVWLGAMRPKTLPAGLAPVVVGAAMGRADVGAAWEVREWGLFAACAIGALSVQVATNFANECLDFRKGADTPDRLGPTRAVAAGLIAPARMWMATGVALAVAGLAALWLSLEVSLGYAFLGLISGVLALAYTGGPLPLAYVGWGDLFVLAFFGVVAVVATGLALGAELGAPLVTAGVGCGLLSTAILAVNNLRDRDGDARARKLTLAVRLGQRFARLEYAACVVGALGCFGWFAMGRDAVAYLPCVPPALLLVQVARVLRGLDGRALNGVLASTGSALLATAALFALVMTRS